MTATALEVQAKRAVTGTRGFRRDIQGLRAVAVLGVVLYHAGIPWLPGGFVGVDVFFVISGYLITGLLIRELRATGRIALRDFYARRIRRLLPAAVLVLLATVACSKLFLPPLLLLDVSKDALAASTFLSNVWFAYSGTDYLAGSSPSLFQHYWSLALEEQFYFVWPLVMVVVGGGVAARAGRLWATLVVLTSLSFIACIFLTSANQSWAFFGLPTRAWELGAGGLLALSIATIEKWPSWIHRVLGWLGFAVICASMMLFSEAMIFPGWAAVIPVLGTLAIIAGGSALTKPLPLLTNGAAHYIGNISYSLYLWHWPLLTLPVMTWGRENTWWIAAAGVAASVALAHLTYNFVELKFQHSNILKKALSRSYVLGAALTIFAVIASYGLGRLPPLDSGRVVQPPSAAEQKQAPPVAKFVPSNVSPRITESGSSLPVIHQDGCHVSFNVSVSPECLYGNKNSADTIVLFGDSHAAQWFSPLHSLASEADHKLISLTKSSCPSVSMMVGNRYSREYPQCEAWRADSIERINALKPSVVVLSNYSSGYRTLGHLGPDGYAKGWAEGLAATLDQLPEDTYVLVLGDTPSWPDAPNVCLSKHLDRAEVCALPATDLLDPEAMRIEQQVVEERGGRFVAPSDWFCGEKCSPVAWNVLVYRDEHHVTDEMAVLLTGKLKLALDLGSHSGAARVAE